MGKQRRRELLIGMLRQGGAMSQESLAEMAARGGEPATQATISRDLAAIGAIKGPGGYRLAGSQVGERVDPGELAAIVRRHAVSVVRAGTLVVVRTAPGHAGLVGAALDRWPPEGAVGTIAGDDTIFVATGSARRAASVESRLASMAFGHGRDGREEAMVDASA